MGGGSSSGTDSDDALPVEVDDEARTEDPLSEFESEVRATAGEAHGLSDEVREVEFKSGVHAL